MAWGRLAGYALMPEFNRHSRSRFRSAGGEFLVSLKPPKRLVEQGDDGELEGTPYPEIRCLGCEDFCGFRSHLTICRQVVSSDVTSRSATHM